MYIYGKAPFSLCECAGNLIACVIANIAIMAMTYMKIYKHVCIIHIYTYIYMYIHIFTYIYMYVCMWKSAPYCGVSALIISSHASSLSLPSLALPF